MSTRRVESFLLRIVVPEDQTLTPECWRGRIQHIASGSEQQIDELAQAVAFIASHLGPLVDCTYTVEDELPTPLG
ncbi:MAG: hypothetical protein HGA45_41880 [Chloroflexales bacterium]|nr:hypothetical protein [Chloroflexales bacterium]